MREEFQTVPYLAELTEQIRRFNRLAVQLDTDETRLTVSTERGAAVDAAEALREDAGSLAIVREYAYEGNRSKARDRFAVLDDDLRECVEKFCPAFVAWLAK